MKDDVKQVAIEFAQKMYPKISGEHDVNIDGAIIANSINSFTAGVEYAQRWISVEDELPEERVAILIKRNNKMLVVGYYIEEHDAFYCPHILYNVTHWRYIELK
jgi:hypothetical protein